MSTGRDDIRDMEQAVDELLRCAEDLFEARDTMAEWAAKDKHNPVVQLFLLERARLTLAAIELRNACEHELSNSSGIHGDDNPHMRQQSQKAESNLMRIGRAFEMLDGLDL